MTPITVFRHRYEQLESSVRNPDSTVLLDLPLALRQLLADGVPLVHQVNRKFQLKIAFTVGLSVRERTEEMVGLGLPSPTHHILAMFPPNEPKRQIGLKELLAFEVVKVNDSYYTSLDLLDVCANKLGGVHYDPRGAEHEFARDLSRLGDFLLNAGMGSTFTPLVVLARVVAGGLNPLYEATNAA